MKGKCVRKRKRNALAAQSGNLYKAQFGKGSKWDALPEPPKKGDFVHKLSRSNRRVKELMVGIPSCCIGTVPFSEFDSLGYKR
jgi:hypothetical protein